jgi:hypothetical protein
MNLHELPSDWPQRQDSVQDQIADLKLIANRLGFHDAADAIEQMFNVKALAYGCHVDEHDGIIDDWCVLDNNEPHKCIYAKPGMRREQCQYWRIKKVEK